MRSTSPSSCSPTATRSPCNTAGTASPEEQGFLHDVQLAACQEFTTVLAPGANIYHYNHIHVDLMRRSSGRRICEPAAIPGEVVAERARGRYATQHYGDPGEHRLDQKDDQARARLFRRGRRQPAGRGARRRLGAAFVIPRQSESEQHDPLTSFLRPNADVFELLHRLVGEFGLWAVAADDEHEDRVLAKVRRFHILEPPDCTGWK